MTKAITKEALTGLVAELTAAGVRVIAPAKAADGGTDYRAIFTLADAILGGEMPRRSLRAVFQPPTEAVFGWERKGTGIELTPAAAASQPQVVLGARPCDAAGVNVLDKVMGWDYKDDMWFARREATTIISLACAEMAPTCFCDKIGLSADATVGADVLLRPAGEGYTAEALTAKGEAFVSGHARWFSDEPVTADPAPPSREAFPLDKIEEWLEGHFEDALWADLGLRCLGCGACTSICPTCHCFDIVDETDGTAAGTRRRNWDTCQTGLFTVHTSGHNPRADQASRCRQRILHKFEIYPKRFEAVLCTGCGRCVQACPAGVIVPEILDSIAQRANGGAA
ncbi:MAG TPA: 4Fe-4S dicluster domain-containing protein [Armatimonadota bacterium]|jgi:ferredoxin